MEKTRRTARTAGVRDIRRLAILVAKEVMVGRLAVYRADSINRSLNLILRAMELDRKMQCSDVKPESREKLEQTLLTLQRHAAALLDRSSVAKRTPAPFRMRRPYLTQDYETREWPPEADVWHPKPGEVLYH